jgi:Enoyl-(Acyl carrier protein) reductase
MNVALLGINRGHLCSKISPVFLHSKSELLYNPKSLRSIFTIDYKSTMAANHIVFYSRSWARIGASVAEKFASNGYKVTVASRSGSGTKTARGFLSLKADFAKPDSIPALFDAVKSEFHASPSVVVYNAAALTNPPNKDSVLSVSAESVTLDLNVNTISPYVAAQHALTGWETLPKEAKKMFIYTGNILNVSIVPIPLFLDLGMGKSASAFWIGLADTSYSAKGFR